MGDGSSYCFYREVQRFRQPWVWLLIALVAGISVWGVVQQLVLGKPFGQNPASDTVLLIVAVVFGLGFPVLFWTASLTTEVRSDGLYYRYFPFHWSFRRISSQELLRYDVIAYHPVRDYGGWGIRYGRGSKAYNVSGNHGVMLELSDGRKLLIGSQKAQELASAISLALGKRSG
ncbi:MAG: DUF6141 family protein [Dehalococcoidia bacterium]|nr:DUF6141 family protein [Dehalococcoidia bacterium]